MKTKRPKPLHEICGRPMLTYILRACYAAGCERILCVVGNGKEEIMAAFSKDKRVHFVEQAEQLGTGHAAQMCIPELQKHHGDVVMLAGDVPLVRGDVLTTLLRVHREEHAAASMATAMLDDPTGYGRIIRDEHGRFMEIVEQVDATPKQKDIKEVFPSFYCVKIDELLFALSRLKNDNKKHEFYLTDIYAILKKAQKHVVAVQAATYEDVLAPNTRQQLCEADIVMQERIQRHHREHGVTIVSPLNTYIEDGVTIGTDTVIQPFSFIGRDSTIGSDCVIGPHASIPRQSILREGATVAGNVSSETAALAPSGS